MNNSKLANSKIKIKVFLVLKILVLLLLTNNSFSQNDQFLKNLNPSDSMIMESILTKINNIHTAQKHDHLYKSKVEELIRYFCFANTKKPDLGSQLLEFYFQLNSDNKPNKHVFFIRNFHCFSKDQKNRVNEYLTKELKVYDPLFYRLISLYKINSHNSFLTKNINTELYNTILSDLKYGLISKQTITQLSCMSTLANLGDERIELLVIETVNKVYNHYSLDTKKNNLSALISFYSDLIPNSLSLLLSKKSVIETMYLLDHAHKELLSDCIAVNNYGLVYYSSVIEPKIKDSGLNFSVRRNFEKSLPNLKNRIKNDNTIWYNNIRIGIK